ncbi:DUF7848 domain-containing protein [Streptomyces sp. NBC_01803]|uniref:DUF7848 domain-containing protein n=1 Tax=Streptomyces sp. NBC_01803 TaxID=2975946 RepID=UPI002DDA0EAA|nr:hypothetical protein [Streptomyces sp. NBC_01803]WSA45747.1 hypothetical protein OIE51_16970 [Streptomyces sp. NBC_01803]
MIRRTIIKAAEWQLFQANSALTEIGDEDAPRTIFRVACVDCGAESEAANNESLPVEMWTLKHTGANPDHRRYRSTMECFWIVLPAPGNPYYDLEKRGGDHPL